MHLRFCSSDNFSRTVIELMIRQSNNTCVPVQKNPAQLSTRLCYCAGNIPSAEKSSAIVCFSGLVFGGHNYSSGISSGTASEVQSVYSSRTGSRYVSSPLLSLSLALGPSCVILSFSILYSLSIYLPFVAFFYLFFM